MCSRVCDLCWAHYLSDHMREGGVNDGRMRHMQQLCRYVGATLIVQLVETRVHRISGVDEDDACA